MVWKTVILMVTLSLLSKSQSPFNMDVLPNISSSLFDGLWNHNSKLLYDHTNSIFVSVLSLNAQ